MKHVSNTNIVLSEQKAFDNSNEISNELWELLEALERTQLHHLRDILKSASQSAQHTHAQRDTAVTVIRNIDAMLGS